MRKRDGAQKSYNKQDTHNTSNTSNKYYRKKGIALMTIIPVVTRRRPTTSITFSTRFIGVKVRGLITGITSYNIHNTHNMNNTSNPRL